MKNLSIRTRILTFVVIMNLLGAVAIIVYLHQSYSRGLDVDAARTVSEGIGGWEQLQGPVAVDPLAQPEEVARILGSMKEITGSDYGYLLDKASVDAASYAAAREAAGLANNWDEREDYALVASTDEAAAELMQFAVDPGSVPEVGKVVGVENGACNKTCHETLNSEDDYWVVRWSNDSKSRAHAVFPVVDAAGSPAGVVYAVQDISTAANAARTSLYQTLVVIAVMLVLATLVIGASIDMLVFKRLARTVGHIQDLSVRVAGGDFDARFEPDGTTDEIGQFEEFFSKLMDLMLGTLKSLTKKSD